jgi:hypothetical protein
MNEVDKIVAATLASASCAAAGPRPREDYIVEYEAFIKLLERRAPGAEVRQPEKTISLWKRLAGGS